MIKVRVKDKRGYFVVEIDLESALELYEGQLHELLQQEYFLLEQEHKQNQLLLSRLKKAGIKPVRKDCQ